MEKKMIDYDKILEEINELWPIKNRPKETRDIEKENLPLRIKNEQDWLKLKNKLEIVIEDNKNNIKKTPTLLNIISSFGQETVIITNQVIVTEQVIPQEDSKVNSVFEEIFSSWPENEIKQNKKYAKQAFVAACKKYSLEEVQKGCVRYITENTDPNKASINVLGIKRFVSKDDILENWIARCEEPLVKYDTAWFDAAWEWYPDFKDKDKPETRDDSLRFYKRFIKNEEMIDFYCAVQAYRSNRRVEIKDAEFNDEYGPGDDLKYTKKFYNFIREWKQHDKFIELSDLLICPVIAAFKSRDIPYWIVYPEEHHIGAIRYWCKQKDDKGNFYGCLKILNAHVEKVSYYLTTGKNHVNVVRDTPIDYSIVSEVIAKVKELARKPPPKPLELKFEP